MEVNELKRILLEHFPDADLNVNDLTGGGDHWRVRIRSNAFVGMSLVQQHQAVYRAFGDLMHGPIHALALDTDVKPSV